MVSKNEKLYNILHKIIGSCADETLVYSPALDKVYIYDFKTSKIKPLTLWLDTVFTLMLDNQTAFDKFKELLTCTPAYYKSSPIWHKIERRAKWLHNKNI